MEINGNKKVNNTNIPVFKGNKNPTENKTQIQINTGADKALNSYGQAIVLKAQANEEEKNTQLLDSTIKNYETDLDCDDTRKKQFIEVLKNKKSEYSKHDVMKNISSSYLLSGYLKDNMALVKQLLEAKDNDFFRFNCNEVVSILEKVTPEKEQILYELIKDTRENKNYNFRFNAKDIVSILDKAAPENKNILSYLIKDTAKDNDDNYRFYTEDILSFLDKVTPGKEKIFYELTKDTREDKNDDFRFYPVDIDSILDIVTPENTDILTLLIKDNSKDPDGNYRFSRKDIISILKNVTPENADTVADLIKDNTKDYNEDYRFYGEDIASIAENLTDENKDIYSVLFNYKQKEEYRFHGGAVASILKYATPENKDVLFDLLKEEGAVFIYRFSFKDIAAILKHVTPENKHILPVLINEKGKYSKYRFDEFNILDEHDIPLIFKNITPENQDILPDLIEAKDKDGEFIFDANDISSILEKVTSNNKDIFYTLIKSKDKNNNPKFSAKYIYIILEELTPENEDTLRSLLKNYDKLELTPQYISYILNPEYNIKLNDIKTIENIIGKDTTRSLNIENLQIACQFKGLLNKQNINEISQKRKKELVRNLVASNTGVFHICEELKKHLPLLPKNQTEYCTLLPALVKSLGIETNELSQADISQLEDNLTSLSSSLKTMSDKDFQALEIKQTYCADEFIKDTFNAVKNLTPEERQKVYDYFGFELIPNKYGTQVDNKIYLKFSITGYPVNLNNGKKLAQIKNEDTKKVIEQLRENVINYSQNNKILCNNTRIEAELNNIIKAFPELRSAIGKIQHKTHNYDLFKHSLKVMQKITQNPEFNNLSASDKKIMLLASLFHDITKQTNLIDKTHSTESAFDTYYILKKMKLSKQEEIKLYTLIKSHEWLGYVNKKDAEDTDKRLKSVAFDLQYDNLFDMAKIFTSADLKAVKQDDGFYLKFKDDFETRSKEIENYINELKTSQPLLPVTPIPKASRINEAITTVKEDGATNIKGVYKNKDGLIIIKFNELENDAWETIGFPKGSISTGIEAKGNSSKYAGLTATEDINTGNIKFFAHGLDYSNQLAKFDAFALPDSDALLSVSYTERPESKYRFFRNQGVLLNTQTKYIHGGGETDSGSGCCKNLDVFKEDYIFGGNREADRKFISKLIKKALNMTDDEYLVFVKKNANKPFTSIEPKTLRDTIIKTFSLINSNTRRGNRAYNEMYITNPEVMGVFAYSITDEVGEVIPFVQEQEDFLIQYALKHDLPFIVFGN